MRGKKLILLIALVAVGLVFGFIFIKPKPPAPRVLPNPNGYDEIVAAEKRLPSSDSLDLRSLAENDLRAFLRTNASTLQLFHEALQKPCAASDWPVATNEVHLGNVSAFKYAARCFEAAGGIAEKDNRYAEAAEDYLNAIRLGVIGLKDGAIIHRLVGTACQAIGTKPLKTMVRKLSGKECRDVISALEKIEQQREPMERTFANEREFMRVQSTFSQQIAGIIMFRNSRKMEERTKEKEDAVIVLERQLMVDLAVRAFELEKGKPPTNVQELTPEYLKVLPQNPTNGTSLAL